MDEEEYRAYRAATDLREPYRYVPAELAPPCGSGGTVNLRAASELTCGLPQLV